MQSDRIDWRKPRSGDKRVPCNTVTSTDAFSTGRTLMTRLIALLLIAGTAFALAGCNTMAGAGEDISKGGNALTNSAEKAK
jgi:predicted small secreted protein